MFLFLVLISGGFKHVISLVEKLESDLRKSLKDVQKDDMSEVEKLILSLKFNEQLYIIEYIFEYFIILGDEKNALSHLYEKMLSHKKFNLARDIFMSILDLDGGLSKEDVGTEYEKNYFKAQKLIEKIEKDHNINIYLSDD